MVELLGNRLRFTFPDVHPDAELTIEFQRTLRIPDDGRNYPLPPGLGTFPLRHVDDFPARLPASWSRHGGVVLPMYQSEALWIRFESKALGDRHTRYPFAVKVAAGKIDAVTGRVWSNDLHREPQDYLVVPTQPWLDGFAVERGVIRQFVAMPLGNGYTTEEQITGVAEHGGLQLLARPMTREAFDRHGSVLAERMIAEQIGASTMMGLSSRSAASGMGLAPGGRMRQEIFDDRFALDDWDQRARGRCFVHLANSLVWEAITGDRPPTPPPTARTYTEHGLPWFDYYAEGASAREGATALRELKSVLEMSRDRGEHVLPENESVDVDRVVRIGHHRRPHVRDGGF